MDLVIPNADYSVDEIEFFVELGLSWLTRIHSKFVNVHIMIWHNTKNEFCTYIEMLNVIWLDIHMYAIGTWEMTWHIKKNKIYIHYVKVCHMLM